MSCISRKKTDPIRNAAVLIICAALFSFAVYLSSASSIKGTVMVIVIVALAAVFLRFQTLRDRVGPVYLALALYVLMDGISTLYATAGKFALYEFLKVLGAFCLATILLAAAPGEGARPGRWIAAVLEIYAGLSSLLSIDLISTHSISGPVLGFLGRFTTGYFGLAGLEAGVRLFSIFDNPNVFAGCMGIGVLLALGLAESSERKWERYVHVALLYLISLGFVLAFSMGATAAIVFAFAAFLVLEPRDRLPGMLVLMLETLALALVAAALISVTSFRPWDGARPVPLLCVVLGAAALCLLDRFIGGKPGKKLAGRGRLIFALAGGALAAVAVFALAAWNLTGDVTLAPGETLRRAAYPEAGHYTLRVEADAPLAVTITSQNQQETMMHTGTELYAGDAAGAQFDVPEDSLVLYFGFSAPEGARLTAASYEGDAGSGEIPLGYKLLPGFMANRLQGLFANENAIQRLVFFADGIRLWRQSPVIGLGMGAFENGLRSVQSFDYQTKYAHNHFIQSLVETGVVGLVLFLGLFALSAVAVWRGRNGHPLVPALGAALVFLAGHAMTEVVFSFYAYLPMAFGVFVLINLCCGDAIPLRRFARAARTGVILGASALTAVYGMLLAGNIYAARITSRSEVTLENLSDAARLDRFEWADYMLSYVNASPAFAENASVRRQADEYAARLAATESNVLPGYLAEYYFQTGRPEQAFDMLEKYVRYVAADEAVWRQAFALARQYGDGGDETETFRTGVLRLAALLEDWNAENMGKITLDEEAEALIAGMRG